MAELHEFSVKQKKSDCSQNNTLCFHLQIDHKRQKVNSIVLKIKITALPGKWEVIVIVRGATRGPFGYWQCSIACP